MDGKRNREPARVNPSHWSKHDRHTHRTRNRRARPLQTGHKMTLQPCLETAIASLWDSTPATRAYRLQHVAWLVAAFGDCPLGDITYARISDWIGSELARGLARNSVHKRLGTLALALRDAHKRGKLDKMPDLPRIKTGYVPRSTHLLRDEYPKVRRHLLPHWQIYADLCVYTAMHTSDIEGMTWADFDGSRFLRRNTKNRAQPVWLPAPGALCESLTSHRTKASASDTDLICRPWPHASRDLTHAAKLAGVHKKLCPLDLRRTFATWWVESGADFHALKTYMGHSKRSIMAETVYAQCTAKMLGSGVAAFDSNRDPAAPSSAPSGRLVHL